MKRYNYVDITILQLVSVIPGYAYDLNKALGSLLGFSLKNSGPVSRALRLLENDGLLISEWEFPEPPLNGPGRKIYSLSEAGKAYLSQSSKPVEVSLHMNKGGKRRP